MKGQELDWGKCPECGEELFNISDHEENLVMCTECGKTFPEPPLGPVTKKRKEKMGKELRLPFGKHKGRTLREVMREEPGYLCWFHDTVEDQREIKAAMEALPDSAGRLAAYRERRSVKQRTLEETIEAVVTRMFRVEPTQQEVDRLCDELFDPSGE
jgi:uncharacterized protein (DUF3820 family)